MSRKNPSRNARSLGATSASQRTNRPPRAQIGVGHGPGALQDEAADEVGVAERQLLGDEAAAGEAGYVGGGNVERAQDPGGVVCHLLN
jgi:hypothetical protein